MVRNISLGILLVAAAMLVWLAGANTSSADVNKLVEGCADCHGKDGVSTEPEIPTIAGFSAVYTIDSMVAYKAKERPCVETKYPDGPNKGKATDMCKLAGELSKGDIEALGEHYEGKKFVPAKQKFDAAKVQQGEKIHSASCEKCHEDGGTSAADDAGFLAGQWMPYLKRTFEQYAAGKRSQPEKMKPKMDKLSKDDIDALLNYYASLQ